MAQVHLSVSLKGLASALLWVLAAGASSSSDATVAHARSPAVNHQPSLEQGGCSYTSSFNGLDRQTLESPEEALHVQLLEHPGNRRVLEDEYWDRFLFAQTGSIARVPDAVQDVWPEGGVTRAAFEWVVERGDLAHRDRVASRFVAGGVMWSMLVNASVEHSDEASRHRHGRADQSSSGGGGLSMCVTLWAVLAHSWGPSDTVLVEGVLYLPYNEYGDGGNHRRPQPYRFRSVFTSSERALHICHVPWPLDGQGDDGPTEGGCEQGAGGRGGPGTDPGCSSGHGPDASSPLVLGLFLYDVHAEWRPEQDDVGGSHLESRLSSIVWEQVAVHVLLQQLGALPEGLLGRQVVPALTGGVTEALRAEYWWQPQQRWLGGGAELMEELLLRNARCWGAGDELDAYDMVGEVLDAHRRRTGAALLPSRPLTPAARPDPTLCRPRDLAEAADLHWGRLPLLATPCDGAQYLDWPQGGDGSGGADPQQRGAWSPESLEMSSARPWSVAPPPPAAPAFPPWPNPGSGAVGRHGGGAEAVGAEGGSGGSPWASPFLIGGLLSVVVLALLPRTRHTRSARQYASTHTSGGGGSSSTPQPCLRRALRPTAAAAYCSAAAALVRRTLRSVTSATANTNGSSSQHVIHLARWQRALLPDTHAARRSAVQLLNLATVHARRTQALILRLVRTSSWSRRASAALHRLRPHDPSTWLAALLRCASPGFGLATPLPVVAPPEEARPQVDPCSHVTELPADPLPGGKCDLRRPSPEASLPPRPSCAALHSPAASVGSRSRGARGSRGGSRRRSSSGSTSSSIAACATAPAVTASHAALADAHAAAAQPAAAPASVPIAAAAADGWAAFQASPFLPPYAEHPERNSPPSTSCPHDAHTPSTHSTYSHACSSTRRGYSVHSSAPPGQGLPVLSSPPAWPPAPRTSSPGDALWSSPCAWAAAPSPSLQPSLIAAAHAALTASPPQPPQPLHSHSNAPGQAIAVRPSALHSLTVSSASWDVPAGLPPLPVTHHATIAPVPALGTAAAQPPCWSRASSYAVYDDDSASGVAGHVSRHLLMTTSTSDMARGMSVADLALGLWGGGEAGAAAGSGLAGEAAAGAGGGEGEALELAGPEPELLLGPLLAELGGTGDDPCSGVQLRKQWAEEEKEVQEVGEEAGVGALAAAALLASFRASWGGSSEQQLEQGHQQPRGGGGGTAGVFERISAGSSCYGSSLGGYTPGPGSSYGAEDALAGCLLTQGSIALPFGVTESVWGAPGEAAAGVDDGGRSAGGTEAVGADAAAGGAVDRLVCVLCTQGQRQRGFLHGGTVCVCVCWSCSELVRPLCDTSCVACPVCQQQVERVVGITV